MTQFFGPLLALHISLAIALFVPSLLLPFALRRRHASEPDRSPLVRALVTLQARGSPLIALGLAVTGLGLVAVLGPSLLGQPWLLLALGIYATNLAIAFFIQRPSLRRLFLGPALEGDQERWRAAARRQRYVSYVMAAFVGLIGFLMTSKPDLW